MVEKFDVVARMTNAQVKGCDRDRLVAAVDSIEENLFDDMPDVLWNKLCEAHGDRRKMSTLLNMVLKAVKLEVIEHVTDNLAEEPKKPSKRYSLEKEYERSELLDLGQRRRRRR